MDLQSGLNSELKRIETQKVPLVLEGLNSARTAANMLTMYHKARRSSFAVIPVSVAVAAHPKIGSLSTLRNRDRASAAGVGVGVGIVVHCEEGVGEVLRLNRGV